MTLTIPAQKNVKCVRELIEDREVDFTLKQGEATITVDLDFDSAARLYYFDLSG